MGLFSKLQNGDTVLKSLKFGKDRPGAGSSNQPYVRTPLVGGVVALTNALTPDILPIPNLTTSILSRSPDFILRGGLIAPISAAEDVARLTKYMFDFKSPSGFLFAAKQNLLSRVAVKTEASKGAGYGGGAFNEGIYTPLSTLTQVGVGFTGTHLNKQGLDPTGLIPALSLKKYEQVAYENSIEGSNRLTNLYLEKQSTIDSQDTYVQKYGGGPGSILGIGDTFINFATGKNGEPLRTGQYPVSTLSPFFDQNFSTWSTQDFAENIDIEKGQIKADFRSKLLKTDSSGSLQDSTFLSLSKGYSDSNNVENNFNLGNPGQKGDVSDFYAGKNKSLSSGDFNSIINGSADKINASFIYKSNQGSKLGKDPNYDYLKDIIPFSIAILNNEDQPGGPWRKYMHFRAFIDSFSDSYDADWKTIEYMGRGEKFYKYGGFDRKISLAFTVAAQSKNEINGMYDKLNFLASSLAPEYLDSYASGYMAGNIAYITLGEYIVDQPGIITSLTYDIPEESPWDIGIDQNGDLIPGNTRQRTTRQVPYMIKVTGFNFIPLHKFRVEKQTFLNDKLGTDSDRLLATGNHRYLDQARPSTTNYDEDRILNDYNKVVTTIVNLPNIITPR